MKIKKAKRILVLVMTGSFLLQLPLTVGAAGTDGQISQMTAEEEQTEAGAVDGISVEARYSSNHIRFRAVADVTGYNVWRCAEQNGTYEKINSAVITGATAAEEYSYIDETAGTGSRYWYKVEAVKDGENTFAGPVQDQYATGITAVHEHARAGQLHRDYVSTGATAFNGSRVETGTAEELNKIKSLSQGTIMVTYKPENASGRKALLAVRKTGMDIPASGNMSGGIGVFQDGSATRLDFSSALRAAWASTGVANAWNTFAFVSGPYTGKEKNIVTAWNGSTQTGYTNESFTGFFTRQTDLESITIGAVQNGNSTAAPYSGEIAYVTVTDEVFSQEEINAYTRAVTTSLRARNIGITELMLDTTFDDNHWVFVGGEAVSAGYDHVGSIRNYVGQYEEYIRWGRILGSPINNRQRFVINSGKEGRTLEDIVTDYDKLVTAFHPRVVAYMVGREDYAAGDAGIEAFKANLKLFIDKTLALKEAQQDVAFAVIQKPFAVRDAADNTKIQMYCDAVDAVKQEYDETKSGKIVVVDHFTQTNNDRFKNEKLTESSRLNVNGHYEIGRQLAVTAFGNASGYWSGPIRQSASIREMEQQPSVYLTEVRPAVTAGSGSLQVTVPDGNGTDWAYQLDMEGIRITGQSSSNHFEIPNLTQGRDYVLKIRSGDGTKQLCTMKGRIVSGDTAVENTQELNENQQRVAEMMASRDSMTWLFMGDSITHGAQFTAGYDSVPQLFEKFLRDELGRKDDTVVNAAVANGDTITTLGNIYQRLEKYTPDVVSIMLGTNDAVVTTADIYEENMREIVSRIRAVNPQAVIILRTPTYAWDDRHITTVPQVTARLKEIADENQDIIYIDQLSWGEKYVGTYSWLRTLNGQYLYQSDTVHPDGNGHLVMFRQFVKAVGLWTEDSRMTNLSYVMPVTAESNATTPVLDTETAGTISLSADALRTASGVADLGAVTLKATIKTTGQSFETEADHDAAAVALTDLPLDTEYTVEVSGYRKNEAKKVSFASQNVTLEAAAEAFDILLSSTDAAALAAGSTVGELSVGEGAPEGSYTYSLAAGEGADDNSKFTIEGTTLKTAEALLKGRSYSIRVRAVNGNAVQEKAFTIYAAGSAVDPEQQAAAPAFDPAAGTYESAQTVTLTSATEGAAIYYTTDGKEPTAESTRYSSPITVDRTMTIKAIAVKDGMKDSPIATAAYIIEDKAPADKPWIFTDVSEMTGNWKYESVKYVYTNEIMGAITGTREFQPDRPLSRSMFATVLYRMAGEPEVAYEDKFSDVPAGKWYSNAIIWAYRNKIVAGYTDGSFGIDDNITRQQIAKMLFEYAKVSKYDISERNDLGSFTDKASVSGWAVEYMQWATAVKMITGKPNDDQKTYRMDPKGDATRAECAAMLSRFADKYK